MIYFKTVEGGIQITKANGDIVTVPASAKIKENCCTASVYLRFDNPANDFQIDFSEQVSVDGANPVTGVDDIGSALSNIFAIVSGGDGTTDFAGPSLGTHSDSGSVEVYSSAVDSSAAASLAVYSDANEVEIVAHGSAHPSQADVVWYKTVGGDLRIIHNNENIIEVNADGTTIYNGGGGTPYIRITADGKIVITGLGDYANDAAAEADGVPLEGLYHTSGSLKTRVA
jgi:hypothetical protein